MGFSPPAPKWGSFFRHLLCNLKAKRASRTIQSQGRRHGFSFVGAKSCWLPTLIKVQISSNFRKFCVFTRVFVGGIWPLTSFWWIAIKRRRVASPNFTCFSGHHCDTLARHKSSHMTHYARIDQLYQKKCLPLLLTFQHGSALGGLSRCLRQIINTFKNK